MSLLVGEGLFEAARLIGEGLTIVMGTLAMGSSVSTSYVCLFFLTRLTIGVSSSRVSFLQCLIQAPFEDYLQAGSVFFSIWEQALKQGGQTLWFRHQQRQCLFSLGGLGALVLGDELSTTPLPVKRSKNNQTLQVYGQRLLNTFKGTSIHLQLWFPDASKAGIYPSEQASDYPTIEKMVVYNQGILVGK